MTANSRIHIFRLKPHADLKQSIIDFARNNNITAGAIVTCVGSLTQYHLRFANKSSGTKGHGHFEIVSLTGIFNGSEGHFHMSIANGEGLVVGGHLLTENFVYTTAEIAVVEVEHVELLREADPETGFRELKVLPDR